MGTAQTFGQLSNIAIIASWMGVLQRRLGAGREWLKSPSENLHGVLQTRESFLPGCWWLEPALTPINASMCDHKPALPPACSSMDNSGEKSFSLITPWPSFPIALHYAEVGYLDLTHAASLDHLQKLSQGMFPACGSSEAHQGRIRSPLYVCELNPRFEIKGLLIAWVETAPLGYELSSVSKGSMFFKDLRGQGSQQPNRNLLVPHDGSLMLHFPLL